MKGCLTPGWVFQVPAIKANLFFPLVGSMIKKENDFIKDNLVDISGLLRLGVETASIPWKNSVLSNNKEIGAGKPSSNTSNSNG